MSTDHCRLTNSAPLTIRNNCYIICRHSGCMGLCEMTVATIARVSNETMSVL